MRAILMLALLLLLGCIFPAFAQVAPACGAGINPRCDQGQAYTDAARTASLGYCGAGKSPTGTNIVHDTLNHAYRGDYKCEGDTSWRGGYMSYYTATCKERPTWTSGYTPPNGSEQCSSGCIRTYYYNDDDTSTGVYDGSVCTNDDHRNECDARAGFYWHPSLNACVPVKPQDCLPGQDGAEGVCNKPEECPEGMVTDENGLCKPKNNECPAGKTKAPDGSCTGDDGNCASGQAKGKDGTCKPDGNGDGKPDDEDDDPTNDPEKNEFSGGDDCKTPPSCSGDPIMCGQARIQWRIDCNTRRNVNVKGGGCNDPPICTGEHCNALEYGQLIQQWRTACAVEALNTVGGDTGVVEFLQKARTDDTNAANAEAGRPDGTEGINESDAWHTFDNSSFNPGMFGGETGGTCSFTTSLELMGRPIELPPEFWMLASMIGWLVVASAYLWVAFQLGG